MFNMMRKHFEEKCDIFNHNNFKLIQYVYDKSGLNVVLETEQGFRVNICNNPVSDCKFVIIWNNEKFINTLIISGSFWDLFDLLNEKELKRFYKSKKIIRNFFDRLILDDRNLIDRVQLEEVDFTGSEYTHTKISYGISLFKENAGETFNVELARKKNKELCFNDEKDCSVTITVSEGGVVSAYISFCDTSCENYVFLRKLKCNDQQLISNILSQNGVIPREDVFNFIDSLLAQDLTKSEGLYTSAGCAPEKDKYPLFNLSNLSNIANQN